MTDQPNAEALFNRVRAVDRAGLLTDIDGTISRIAPSPDAAVVDTAAIAALQQMSTVLTLTGVVTGRSAEEAYRMIGLDQLVYSGNHGMEIWRNGRLEQSPLALEYTPKIAQVLDSLEGIRQVEGLVVENKLLTASIHYRAVDNPGAVEQMLLEEVSCRSSEFGLRMTRGQKVIEIRPPVELSKGTSVVELIREYNLEGLIFIGDDITDVDAFEALLELRSRTGGNFYAIGVRGDATPEVVERSADAMVEGVDGVISLLGQR